MFKNLPDYVEDPILGLFDAYRADVRTRKVNLGIGIYCDEDGRVPVLASVRAARERIDGTEPCIYLPTEGLPGYRNAVRELVFGGATTDLQERVVTIQTAGGTGALRIGAEFLASTNTKPQICMPDPTWVNHQAIFQAAGFEVSHYPYCTPDGRFDIDGALATFKALPAGTVVLLHPCCHNPTGIDPSREEWGRLLDAIAQRALLPFFDMAYQGFAEGLDDDAWAVRECARREMPCLVASSYSKNFSLYGERVGALSIHAPGLEVAKVLGQLKVIVRRSYSCPPAQGAMLVATVLQDVQLHAQWRAELDGMRLRMLGVRASLHALLTRELPDADLSFLTRQRGMFSYSGLSGAQIERLRSRHGVYVVSSGRICIAGINASNIAQVCEALVETGFKPR
ncbi:aminotransferase class I/II-fold pyridoxal phosphate-dependent enzyme [Variovorax sp. RKNM96]|uniref:amino acid aminotransferase n=1 Tax=Variovorax sp. RKNM96 TaxID=2681552 RepID=UPI00197F8658|nr:amino acid aminotransferase [Variovorax sp. RKNM96]QSI30089.1 aminotransferase class I/II-fold pyridoxal phosphate-dependent enzyme [Variovorax sp. RKNM96]